MKGDGHSMKRAARTASLLVAFYLLTSAATAYAECAWVLWDQGRLYDLDGKSYVVEAWHVMEAHPTLQDCNRSRTNQYQYMKPGKDNRGEYSVVYTCLPDTVDPREPKGK